jgi:RNA polymerase sigma-32 factor
MPKRKNTLSMSDKPTAEFEDSVEVAEIAPVFQPEERSLVPYDPLQLYLSEIKNYGLLTREEEKELGIRVRKRMTKKRLTVSSRPILDW